MLSTYLLHNLKRVAGSRVLWLLFVVAISFQSCTNTVNDDGEYSKSFKPVFDSTTLYYGVLKQPEKGTRYLDSAYHNISQPHSQDIFRYYAFHFVYDRKVTHNTRSAILYSDSMLAAAKHSVTQKQYLSNYAEASFAAGDAYFDLLQFDEAYKYFYQGYSLGKNNIDNAILAEYTYRMGMIMFKQANYREAANYFKLSYRQSFAYHDDFRAFYQRQELLADIGESYKNSGDIDSSKLYLNKALKYIDDNDARFKSIANNLLDVARGVVYGDQGDVALITHNFRDAEQLLKKSIAINLKPENDNKDAQLTEIKLARLYYATNKQDELFKLLQSLRKQLDAQKNDDAETSWYNLMSDYYTRKKDYNQALAYFKTYSSLKDSAIEQAATLKRTDVTQQQANFDKEGQIESLKDHNKLQLVYIYLAVIFSVMAVVIIFLVFRNLKRSKQDVVIVKNLNDQINKQKISLENTLEEVNQGSREKDRILRAVAHDLRNPLGGIASLSSAMAGDEYTEEQMDLINLIKETSFNSLELINEILEAANTSTAKFNKEWVDINGLLNNSVELLRFKAAEKKQNIIVELLAEPKEIHISREKIWRVVSNLISNAIKFSHAGSAIVVAVSAKGDGVEIAVKDNGIGVPDKLQPQIFNMFTDAKRSGTEGEKSFGLGLSICKQIVEKHGGKIWLQSDTEHGSTFFIYLPTQSETNS